MKAKIKEVQDYFKDKILKGDFETVSIDHVTIEIIIDNEYKFSIWHDGQDFVYRSPEFNFIHLVLDIVEEDRKTVFQIVNPIIKKDLKEKVIATKTAELETLKNELTK